MDESEKPQLTSCATNSGTVHEWPVLNEHATKRVYSDSLDPIHDGLGSTGQTTLD